MFKKILSTVLAVAMVGAMSTNVMASEVESGGKSTRQIYCNGSISNYEESTSIFGNKTIKYYCYTKSSEMETGYNETHVCFTEKYNKNNVWQSTSFSCPYGYRGGTAKLLRTQGVYEPFCANEIYDTTVTENFFTKTKTYTTRCWHNETDGFGLKLHTGTHPCTTEKYDKNGKFLGSSVICVYGGGTGSARKDNDL